MSTEMAAFIEYNPTEKYIAYCEIFFPRDYEIFALMANVRYENDILKGITPVSEAKGFPLDASKLTKEKYDDEQGHDPSYLSIEELQTVHEKYLTIPSIDMNDKDIPSVDYGELLGIIDMMKALNKVSIDESRLVFWFIS